MTIRPPANPEARARHAAYRARLAEAERRSRAPRHVPDLITGLCRLDNEEWPCEAAAVGDTRGGVWLDR